MSQTIHVKIFDGDHLIGEKSLTREVIKIGRLKTSHLHLEDDAIARMHAVIECSGSDVRVVDLGSTTGTRLRGQRVEKNAVLRHGDELQFGRYRLLVEIPSFTTAIVMEADSQPPSQIPPIRSLAKQPSDPTSSPAGSFRPIPVDLAAVERQDGSAVVEVTAMYGRTVLDVQHVGQIEPRQGTAPLFLATGAGLVIAGAILFGHDATFVDWSAHEARVQAAHEQGEPLPTAPEHAWGTGTLGWLLMLLGIVPFGIGLVRMNDKGLLSYTIGESHSSTFHVPSAELAGSAAFPLVQIQSGGSPALGFTSSMTGDVTALERTVGLIELVDTGRVEAVGGRYVYALPTDARCRIACNGITFHVNSVAPGKAIATRSQIDGPFWTYSGGALLALGTLLVMAHLVPNESEDLDFDEAIGENRFVGYMNQPNEAEPEPVEQVEPSREAAGGHEGARHAGEEGAMGNRESPNQSGHYAMRGPADARPQMARDFNPSVEAREAGILGMFSQDRGHFISSPFGEAIAIGNDDRDVWGSLTGTEVGEAFGVGGLGLIGKGRGGGDRGEGTIGLGQVGLMGSQGHGDGGYGPGRGSGTGFGPRQRRPPRVDSTAIPKLRGALDREIIRRVVRGHINEVRHCYNQGLVRDPNLAGRVAIQFSIAATGSVPVAVVESSSLKDLNVANCVAKAVKRWRFPKPEGGGTVLVTYPFVLSPG